MKLTVETMKCQRKKLQNPTFIFTPKNTIKKNFEMVSFLKFLVHGPVHAA